MDDRIFKFENIIEDSQKYKKRFDMYPSFEEVSNKFPNYKLYFIQVADYVNKNRKKFGEGHFWPEQIQKGIEKIIYDNTILESTIDDIKKKRYSVVAEDSLTIENELEEIRADIVNVRDKLVKDIVDGYKIYLKISHNIDFDKDYGKVIPEGKIASVRNRWNFWKKKSK